MNGKAINGARIMQIGDAYKKDINDMRESPAIDILVLLHQYGAKVSHHDPYVPRFSEGGHDYASVPLTEQLLSEVDGVLIVTDHTNIDWPMVKRAARVVVDTRHILALVR